MIVEVKKSITVMRVPNTSEYLIANFQVIGDSGNKKIGGSVTAENAMLVNKEELETYMPNILGLSPSDPRWGDRLDTYIRSISVPVPENGLALNIGFVFDNTDILKKSAIAAYIKDNKLSEGDFEDVVEHLTINVNRNFWWKYATPMKAEDYFLWRYIQRYHKVANKLEDADNKSLKIMFYILDEDEIKSKQIAAFELKTKANKLFNNLLESPEKARAVLLLMEQYNIVLTAKSKSEYLMALDTIRETDVARFIEAASDLEQKEKAVFLRECIAYNILAQYPNSTVVYDGATGNVIGNNLREAAAYIFDPVNEKYNNTIRGLLKSKVV